MTVSSFLTLRAGIVSGAAALGLLLWFGMPPVELLEATGGPGRGHTAAVFGSHTVGQTFRAQRDELRAIEVVIAPPAAPDMSLTFALFRTGEQAPLREVRGTLADLRAPDDRVRFSFAQLMDVREADLTFTLRAPAATSEEPLRVRYEIDSRSYPAGTRLVNDQPRPGDLAFTAWRRGALGESWRHRILEEQGGQWLAALALLTVAALAIIDAIRLPRGRRTWNRAVVLASLALALLTTFPLYHHMARWADDNGDWPEVVSHLAVTRYAIQAGQLPGWNPYICGGSPNLANPQPFFLSAALPLSFLVGEVVATKLAITIGLAIGIAGMAFLAQTLGLRGPALFLPALIFPFSGFMTSHLANGQLLWLTVDYLPWITLGFVRALRSSRWWLLLTGSLTALTLVEGRVYLVAYIVVLLVILGLGYAVAGRSWRPLVNVALALLLAFGLAAWKLLPTLWFLHDRAQALPNTNGIPLAALDDAFLKRNVTANTEDIYGTTSIPRHEYAAYVGLVPLLLAALGLLTRPLRFHTTVFAIAGGVFLALAMQTANWSLFEYLPLTRELRNPSRMIIVVVLALSVLAGAGLQQLTDAARHWSARLRAAALIPWVLLALVGLDLLLLNASFFSRIFYAPASPATYDSPKFFQTRLPERQPANGYPTVLAGKGAKDFCPPVLRAYQPENPVRAREDARYRGETYAVKPGTVTLSRFSPNILEIAADSNTPNTVVVNQKYDRGWRASPYTVRSVDGLLSADIPAGRHVIVLQYRVPGLGLGATITFATAASLLLARWRSRAP